MSAQPWQNTTTDDKDARKEAKRQAKEKNKPGPWSTFMDQVNEQQRIQAEKAAHNPKNVVTTETQFGPFRLDGHMLLVDGKTFDLHDSSIEFATDGQQKRFTGTRVVAGVAAGTLVFPPLALFALKRKDRKANAITVVDAAGQSFQFTFTQKNVLAAQAFLLKVQAIQQSL